MAGGASFNWYKINSNGTNIEVISPQSANAYYATDGETLSLTSNILTDTYFCIVGSESSNSVTKTIDFKMIDNTLIDSITITAAGSTDVVKYGTQTTNYVRFYYDGIKVTYTVIP